MTLGRKQWFAKEAETLMAIMSERFCLSECPCLQTVELVPGGHDLSQSELVQVGWVLRPDHTASGLHK